MDQDDLVPPDHDARVLMPDAPIPADGIGAFPLFLFAMGRLLKNLPVLFGLYLPLAAVSTALLFLGAPTFSNPPPPSANPAGFVIPPNEWIAVAGWALFVFSLGTWSSVAVFRSAHAALTTGRALGFGAAYGSAIERVPNFFATQLLYGLMAACGLVACFVPGFWLLIVFAPALPRAATRAVGPIQALGEARDLVRGRFWRVAGFMGLVGLTVYAVLIPYFTISFVLPHGEPWVPWVRGIGNALSTTVIAVIQTTAYVALHERLEETA